MSSVLIVAVMIFTIANADEIVNFTLNKSKPDNPWLVPFHKNEPNPKTSQDSDDVIPKNSKEDQSPSNDKETILSPLIRTKEVLIDFLRNPRTCASDSECTFTQFCYPSTSKCAKRASECLPIKINGDVTLKADIVFVGDGFNNSEELEKVVRDVAGYNEDYYGVMSVEPFKSNEKLFNIWMVTAGGAIPKNIWEYIFHNQVAPDRSTSMFVADRCDFADYVVILSKHNYRSFAYTNENDSYVSLPYYGEDLTGFQVLHELGHTMGKLADEYVEETKGDRWKWPNCAPDRATAEKWWGNISGAGYYEGCSYVKKNFRPTPRSIMSSDGPDFGEVNKRHLQSVFVERGFK